MSQKTSVACNPVLSFRRFEYEVGVMLS